MSCLIFVLIFGASADLFAEEGSSLPTSSCLSDSSRIKAAQAETAKLPCPLLVNPSRHQAEARSFQVAQRITSDPRLFSLEVRFEDGFLQRESGKTGFDMNAEYATPCDQTQFLSISVNHMPLRHLYVMAVGVGPFVLPSYPCAGGAPRFEAFSSPPKPLDAEPAAMHLPLQGWTVDLSQLWMIARKHEALFANGVRGCLITTVGRLREEDSKSQSQCGQFTAFDWNASVHSERKKRLLNEQDRRTVVELIEQSPQVPQTSSASANRNCEEGHYLIVDAHSSADIESGTYLTCYSPPA